MAYGVNHPLGSTVFRGKLASASLKHVHQSTVAGGGRVFRGKLASASLKRYRPPLASVRPLGIPRQACLGLIEASLDVAKRPAMTGVFRGKLASASLKLVADPS